mgnify:FL=1
MHKHAHICMEIYTYREEHTQTYILRSTHVHTEEENTPTHMAQAKAQTQMQRNMHRHLIRENIVATLGWMDGIKMGVLHTPVGVEVELGEGNSSTQRRIAPGESEVLECEMR